MRTKDLEIDAYFTYKKITYVSHIGWSVDFTRNQVYLETISLNLDQLNLNISGHLE